MKTRSKPLVILVLIIAALMGVLGWVGYRSFKTCFSAKAEPHALEVFLARQIRHLAIPI